MPDLKQPSVIVKQSSVYQYTGIKKHITEIKLEEKHTPVYVSEKNLVSRQQQ